MPRELPRINIKASDLTISRKYLPNAAFKEGTPVTQVAVSEIELQFPTSRPSNESIKSRDLENVVVVEDPTCEHIRGNHAVQVGKEVFISYSRRDKEYVLGIVEHILKDFGKSVWFDATDIHPAADWWNEICDGIRSAQYCICMISNAWLSSEVCQQELQYAVECGKAIVPLVIGDIDYSTIDDIDPSKKPSPIKKLNWIFFRPTDDREIAFEKLLVAITENLEMVKKHTWLLQMASVWEASNYSRDNLLQRPKVVKDAQDILNECAIGNGPPAIPLQTKYLKSSKLLLRQRRRLMAVFLSSVVVMLSIALAVTIYFAVIFKWSELRARDSEAVAKRALTEADCQRNVAEIAEVAAVRAKVGAITSLRHAQNAFLAANSPAKDLPLSERLLMAAEALRRMDEEHMPGLSVAYNTVLSALRSAGGNWLYEGSVLVFNGRVPSLSSDGNVIAFHTNATTILVISGLLSRHYRYKLVQSTNASALPRYLRISNDGSVLLALEFVVNTLFIYDLRGSSHVVTGATHVLPDVVDALIDNLNGVVIAAYTDRLVTWPSVEDLLTLSPGNNISLSGTPAFDFNGLASCTHPTTNISLVIAADRDSEYDGTVLHVLQPWPEEVPSMWKKAVIFAVGHYESSLRFDPTCTWLLSGEPGLEVNFFKIDAPRHLSKQDSNRVEVQKTTLNSNICPMWASNRGGDHWIGNGTAIVACATDTGNQLLVIDLFDTVEDAVLRWSLPIPGSSGTLLSAVVAGDLIAVALENSPAMLWAPLGPANAFTSTLHSVAPTYLLHHPQSPTVVSIGVDGMGSWDVSCGVEGFSPLQACPSRPCGGYHIPSHDHIWWTTLCSTNPNTAYIYRSNDMEGAQLVRLKEIDDARYYKAEYERTASKWVALFYPLDASENVVAMDVYDLSAATGHVPSLRYSFSQSFTSLDFTGWPFGPFCQRWVVFANCLMYLPADGNATCVHRTEGKEVVILISDDCRTAAAVVKNEVRYFLSLSPDGMASEITTPLDQGLYINKTQAKQHCTTSQFPKYFRHTFSPDQKNLALICSNDDVIEESVVLLLLEWPSGALLASTSYALSTERSEITFSYDSRFLAFQRKTSLVIWDLSRLDYASQELRPPLQNLYGDYSIAFSVDSQYLLAYSSDSGLRRNAYHLERNNKMEVFPVTGKGYLEAACALAGRDLTDEEWNRYGLVDMKDHVTCPGRVMADGCFGVPKGGEVSANRRDLVMDACKLESFSYAVQLSMDAAPNTTYQISTTLSSYPTRVGVYDALCALPAIAYSSNGSVNVTTSDSAQSRRLNIVVSSSDPLSCGTLHIGVMALPTVGRLPEPTEKRCAYV